MNKIYITIFLIAFIVRLYFIVYFPALVGDGHTYQSVAMNILSGCGVSMSLPDSHECIPHFGGNQGPGYPFFIAIIWAVSEKSDLIVRIVQAALCSLSILYLTFATYNYSLNKRAALIVGLVIAISPLHVAWPRFIFTEGMALAATCWVFAELLRSLKAKELRVIPLAVGLIVATFVRLDAVLLFAPLIVASFLTHNPLKAMKKVIQVGLILTVPWSAWMYRNHLVGLDHLFSPLAVELGHKASGFYRWEKTWATTVYESMVLHFPVSSLAYEEIFVPQNAFASQKEEKLVTALLTKLKEYSGSPFPVQVDDEFRKIAVGRINDNPVDYFFVKPLLRIKSLWFNFNAGMGWPGFDDKLTAEDRIALQKTSYVSKLQLVFEYPEIGIGKVMVSLWRVCLYSLFLIALIICFKGKKKLELDLMLLVISFILARSIFTGLLNHVEARFSVLQMPIIELGTMYVLANFFSIKKV